MKISDLATKTGYSVAAIRRLASERKIPGAKRTEGGHYRFQEGPKIDAWLTSNRKRWGQSDYAAPLNELIRFLEEHQRNLRPTGFQKTVRRHRALKLRDKLTHDLKPLVEKLKSLQLL